MSFIQDFYLLRRVSMFYVKKRMKYFIIAASLFAYSSFSFALSEDVTVVNNSGTEVIAIWKAVGCVNSADSDANKILEVCHTETLANGDSKTYKFDLVTSGRHVVMKVISGTETMLSSNNDKAKSQWDSYFVGHSFIIPDSDAPTNNYSAQDLSVISDSGCDVKFDVGLYTSGTLTWSSAPTFTAVYPNYYDQNEIYYHGVCPYTKSQKK
jgi:hypothetical protein